MKTDASKSTHTGGGAERRMLPNPDGHHPGRIKTGILSLTFLAGCILLMIYVALTLQLSGNQLSRFAGEAVQMPVSGAPAIPTPINGLRRHLHTVQVRMLLLGLLVFAVMTGAVIVIRKRVVQPLTDIRNALDRLAAGKLDQMLRISGRGEIASMGEKVNDIAANQQEVLLHLWSQTEHSIGLIDRISETVNTGLGNGNCTRVHADLESVRSSMENLKCMTDGIRFYNVQVEGKSAVTPETSTPDAGPEAD